MRWINKSIDNVDFSAKSISAGPEVNRICDSKGSYRAIADAGGGDTMLNTYENGSIPDELVNKKGHFCPLLDGLLNCSDNSKSTGDNKLTFLIASQMNRQEINPKNVLELH